MARKIDNRTSAFQGMRLIAIFGIVIGHLGINLIGGGAQLCSFFFILSGFLYKGISTQDKTFYDSYKGYVYRKASNIYPVYWFCLVSYLLLAVIRNSPSEYHIDYSFIPHFFLLQSWIPWEKSMAYLGPAWFLSSLLFCYILSPILGRTINRFKLCAFFIFVFLILIWSYFKRSIPWLNYVSPLYRVLEYSAGLFLHTLIFDKPQKKEIHWIISIIIIAGYLISLHYVQNVLLCNLLHIFVIAYIYLNSSSMINSILGNKYAVWVSYYDIFIYLIHPGIAFHILFPIVGHKAWIVAIGSMIIGVIFGMSFNYCKKLIYK